MPVASQHRTLFYRGHKPGKGIREKGIPMLLAIINFIQAWKRYNASLNELYQLGDRELADIGITRSDIPRIAWDSASVKR